MALVKGDVSRRHRVTLEREFQHFPDHKSDFDARNYVKDLLEHLDPVKLKEKGISTAFIRLSMHELRVLRDWVLDE